MSILLAALIGVVGTPPENTIPPYISPAVVCDTKGMTIIKDPEQNLSLGVITHDNHIAYIADHAVATMIPFYWTHNEVSFRADDLYGIDYVDGSPTLRKVFQELGTYEFIFSDSQYAEPENAIRITRTVTFVGKDHPDCPNHPF